MITEREIFLTDPEEKAKVVEFLKGFDLTFTGIIDYTMGQSDQSLSEIRQLLLFLQDRSGIFHVR